MSTSASRRNRKVMFQEPTSVKDGYGGRTTTWQNYAPARAAIYFGTGRESREAAQETASQAATFEVLANAKTRALTTQHRVCYPITDPSPDKWPAWDIKGISEIGRKGLAITATRAA